MKAVHGFSLLELSIVLVIMGLLAGGVLAGQALIHAAELRAIPTEYQRYIAATQSFRDKYLYLPGDMPNATQFWGMASPNNGTNCTDMLNASGTGTSTCNGNGDGMIIGKTYGTGFGVGLESFRYWQHLQNAGMLEGSLTGRTYVTGDTSNGNAALPGTNVPRTKSSGTAGWHITWKSTGDDIPDSRRFDASIAGQYGHFFSLGNQWSPTIINLLPSDYGGGGPYKPEDVWNIDTKIDDGKPASGKLVGYDWKYCTTASNAMDSTAQYKLQDSSKDCSIILRDVF